jgi:broad specificity phosphatase PhoE
MRLLLIRHGQTPANVRGELDTGRPGPSLTPLGRAQAASLPAALAAESIDAVFASALVRTAQTAAPLAAACGLEVAVLDGTHEIEAGDLEMATDHDSYRAYLETCIAWGSGDRARRMPGGTDGRAFFERFDASIARAGSHSTAVVVSHAAAMRVWVAGTARNIEPISVTRQELDNTGLVVLEGSPDTGWDLVDWHGEPLGGDLLGDDSAEDPTGEGIDEALV